MDSAYLELRKEKKKKWDRVLPYGDYVVDRWEKAEFLGFGKGTSIYDNSLVFGNVKVGTDTWIGPNTILDGSGNELIIGNHCSISTGVQIYTHNTVKFCVSGGKCKKEVGRVLIGNNCYIAPSVVIGLDVILGESCVVCANSYVNKSFDSFSILAGNPAVKIGAVKIENDGTVEFDYRADALSVGGVKPLREVA